MPSDIETAASVPMEFWVMLQEINENMLHHDCHKVYILACQWKRINSYAPMIDVYSVE